MFRVMKPTFSPVPGTEFWTVKFKAVEGVLVSSMAEARRTYGCAVVLEYCGGVR